MIAVDGKALKGSARLTAPHRHLLSAVTHGTVVTLAQVGVGMKTNETTHLRPLLAPLDLAGAVVTFDALHSVKANIAWLVETKKAHYIAVIKTNQPVAHRQLSALPWRRCSHRPVLASAGYRQGAFRRDGVRRQWQPGQQDSCGGPVVPTRIARTDA
jgi:Transposase DDE domain